MVKTTGNKFFGSLSNFISQNVASLSMMGGLIMFGGALFAAYKASNEVHKINETYKEKVQEIEEKGLSEADKKAELKEAKGRKITETLFAEKYTIILALAGTALEAYANYSNGVAIAGLSTIVASKQKEIKTWVKNTKESLTAEKFEEIKGKSLEDMISKNFNTKDGPKMYNTLFKKAPDGSSFSGDIYIDSSTGKLFQFGGSDEDMNDVLRTAKEYCQKYGGIEMAKFYNMLGFELPDEYTGKGLFWGPNNKFNARIEKREELGAILKVIVHENAPLSPKAAGCPFAL